MPDLSPLWILPADFAGGVVSDFNLPAGGVFDLWARRAEGYVAVRVSNLERVFPASGEAAWSRLGTVEVPMPGGPNSGRVGLAWPGGAPEALVLSAAGGPGPGGELPPPEAARLSPAASWLAPPHDDCFLPAELRVLPLAEECVASCNPAIGDLDGDGLDEFAVPYSLPDGRDCVACFKGDGRLLWVNEELAFYQHFYDDPDRYAGFHLHDRVGHRHLWAAVQDADGDGQPEVVVGIGPLHVLDGRTGRVKAVIDLRGGIHFWCFAHFDGPGQPASLVAAVDPLDREGPGFVVALSATAGFPERWRVAVPTRRFEDCIKPGDLDGNGREVVAFSLSEVRQFWAMDGNGAVRWKVDVEAEIGDDTHIDDFRYTVHPRWGRCLVSGTGGALIDAGGRVLWTLRERLEHGQTVHLLPDPEPGTPAFYFADSFDGRALFATLDGEVTAVMEDFSRVVPERRGELVHRLTTAGDLTHWGPGGGPVVVQGEIVCVGRRRDVPAGPLPLRLSAIAPDGRYLGRLPVIDRAVSGSMMGPMCVRACRATRQAVQTGREDLLVVLHAAGQAVLYSLQE